MLSSGNNLKRFWLVGTSFPAVLILLATPLTTGGRTASTAIATPVIVPIVLAWSKSVSAFAFVTSGVIKFSAPSCAVSIAP